MKLDDVLGKRVLYKGDEGITTSGTIGGVSTVVIQFSGPIGVPPRTVRVPEHGWAEIEFLPYE